MPKAEWERKDRLHRYGTYRGLRLDHGLDLPQEEKARPTREHAMEANEMQPRTGNPRSQAYPELKIRAIDKEVDPVKDADKVATVPANLKAQ